MDKKTQLKLDVLRIHADKLLNQINKQIEEYELVIAQINELTEPKPKLKNSWDNLLDDSEHMAIRDRMNKARTNLTN